MGNRKYRIVEDVGEYTIQVLRETETRAWFFRGTVSEVRWVRSDKYGSPMSMKTPQYRYLHSFESLMEARDYLKKIKKGRVIHDE